MKPLEFTALHGPRQQSPSNFTDPSLQALETAHTDLGEELTSFLSGVTPPNDLIDKSLSLTESSIFCAEGLVSYLTPSRMMDVKPDSQEARASSAAGNLLISLFTTATLNSSLSAEQGRLTAQDSDAVAASRLAVSLAASYISLQRTELANSYDHTAPRNSDLRYNLFTKRYEAYRNTTTGFCNEVDFTLLALALCARRPGLCYVPAPPQYERGEQALLRFNPNIDGIFFNLDKSGDQPTAKEVIGVQIKSSNNMGKNEQDYDPETTIIIDAQRDLGNKLHTRLSPIRSDRQTISWPGQHAVQSLLDMCGNPNRLDIMRYFGINPKQLQQSMQSLLVTVGQPAPNFHSAITTIESIVAKKISLPPKKLRNRSSGKKRKK